MTPEQFVERSRALLAEYDAGTPPVTVLVPFVVGLTQAAANAAILAAGLVVGATGTASSGTVAAGLVISQTPPAGAVVAHGSPVALTVSTGVGTGCPVVPGMPPKGTQWHQEYRSPQPPNNARRNLDWLMGCYGSSWAFSYAVRSHTALSNDLVAVMGSEGNYVINAFAANGPHPEGVLIPFGTSVQGQSLRSVNPACTVPLPYSDNWSA